MPRLKNIVESEGYSISFLYVLFSDYGTTSKKRSLITTIRNETVKDKNKAITKLWNYLKEQDSKAHGKLTKEMLIDEGDNLRYIIVPKNDAEYPKAGKSRVEMQTAAAYGLFSKNASTAFRSGIVKIALCGSRAAIFSGSHIRRLGVGEYGADIGGLLSRYRYIYDENESEKEELVEIEKDKAPFRLPLRTYHVFRDREGLLYRADHMRVLFKKPLTKTYYLYTGERICKGEAERYISSLTVSTKKEEPKPKNRSRTKHPYLEISYSYGLREFIPKSNALKVNTKRGKTIISDGISILAIVNKDVSKTVNEWLSKDTADCLIVHC